MMDQADSRRSLFERNGFVLPKTSGKSMRPLLWEGEHRVIVTPLKGEPAVGDLLMFTLTLPDGGKKNIVHRLVEIKEAGGRPLYVTRGDNCLGCERVRAHEIIGRVAEVHRVSGFRPWHAVHAAQFSLTDPRYLRYSRLWERIWPLRRFYYRLRAHLHLLPHRLHTLFK